MIRLRPAYYRDARQLWQWQHEPGTRKYARTPTAAPWDEHCRWLQKQLRNARPFKIILSDNEPVGSVRLDPYGVNWEVSIIIGRAHRRQGIAMEALRLTLDEVEEPIYAEVHPANEASHTLFQRAGWRAINGGYMSE